MTQDDRHYGNSLRESEVEIVSKTASVTSSVIPSVMGMGSDARSRSDISDDPNVLRPACAEPGCRVRPELCVYRHPSGGKACISHAADQKPKIRATGSGGEAARRRKVRYMPVNTLNPDWSTPKALRAWLEDRAGRVERGELDLPAVPVKLAEIARATHNDEALEKLDGLEALMRSRLTGSA